MNLMRGVCFVFYKGKKNKKKERKFKIIETEGEKEQILKKINLREMKIYSE